MTADMGVAGSAVRGSTDGTVDEDDKDFDNFFYLCIPTARHIIMRAFFSQ